MKNPTVFISYSWDSESHKEWVLKLAKTLIENGVQVFLDQYDLSVGKDMTHFMEYSLTADRILVIMTPSYKSKADNRSGGVGYEYSMLTREFYMNEPNKNRILPILRDGDVNTSSPHFMQTKVHHDMRDSQVFEAKLFELIRAILDKPKLVKPQLGKLPDFGANPTPDIDKLLTGHQQQQDFVTRKKNMIRSREGVELFTNEMAAIIDQIIQSLDNYQNNFKIHFYKKIERRENILFSSENFTFYLGYQQLFGNTTEDVTVTLSLFQGRAAYSDMHIQPFSHLKNIYNHSYRFDLDEAFQPVFVREDNKNIVHKGSDLATIAVREVITKGNCTQPGEILGDFQYSEIEVNFCTKGFFRRCRDRVLGQFDLA